jgi:hypothetical protein
MIPKASARRNKRKGKTQAGREWHRIEARRKKRLISGPSRPQPAAEGDTDGRSNAER